MDKERQTDSNSPEYGDKRASVDASLTERRGRLSSLSIIVLEWLATLVAVLAFFLFLIWGSTFILPVGTSLINLEERDQAGKGAGFSDDDMALSSQTSALGQDEQVAAILSDVQKRVKHRSAKTISWVDALKGMSLYDQDVVKTASASYAEIEFDDSNKLQLGPDSLVIVKRLEADPWLLERRSALVMMEGELRGTMVASLDETAANVEVVIPGGIARINRIKDPDKKVDYKIMVNPDESTSVVVFEGIAEVEAQNKTVELGANQVTLVVKGAAPTKPVILPDNIKLMAPADKTVTYFRDFPQEVFFSWEKTKESRYRLEIARDILYQDVLLDEIVVTTEFIHGDLHHGNYYWRVAGIATDGTEGQFSKTHQLTVVQDIEPPRLQVNYPNNANASERYILEGIVEPGATLIINGVEVKSDEHGRFKTEVKLKKGINVVVAQAVDSAGNTTFVSERVSRDF